MKYPPSFLFILIDSSSELIFSLYFLYSSRGNCAVNIHGPSGGWWFRSCYHSQLNAEWGRSTRAWHNNVWNLWKGANDAIKASVMKFRCD